MGYEEKPRAFGEGIEFDDVENFSTEDKQFSHQLLIMKCLNKCVDYGTVEMVEGRVETKVDKQGNYTTKYLPDTRRQFIEAVITTKNFMRCDFDEEATKNILNLIEKVQEVKEKWLKMELKWWNNLDYEAQQRMVKDGKGVIEGMHNQKHFFKDSSIAEQLEIWREILEELNLLTERLKFYERETYTA